MKSCEYAYKASKEKLPSNLQKRFLRGIQVHNYSTRNCQNMYLKPYKSSLKSMCPSVKGSNYFNELPLEIQNKKSLSCFKKNLKRMFLNLY